MNSKIIASVVGAIVLVGAGGYYYVNMNQAQANPDYICSAKIVNPVCNYDVNSCTWNNGVGTCTGTKQVSITYSSSRITCDGSGDWTRGHGDDTASIYNSIAGKIGGVVQSSSDSEKSEVTGQYNLQYSTESCVVTGVPAPATNTNTNTTAGTGSSNGYVESETASGDTNTGSAQ